MHVSKEVLWISPLVDLSFFLIVSLSVWLISRLSQRIPSIQVLVFLLTFLTIYDWLALTNRLYHRACLIMALGVAVAFTRWIAKREASSVTFWKKSTPWLAAVFLLTLWAIQGGKWAHEKIAVARLPAAPQSAPNVLVIVLDTLRADHLSSYGYSRPTSQGVLFENAIAPCSWSLPSHPSLLTGRAFFAFLNYLDVHYSYGGPPGYPKPDWDRGTTVDEYDAGLKYVDDYIGRLLRELERREARNTIVVITSDHGESLGAHGLSYHGAALYRELIQVPLIISYPQQIPKGLRVAVPVSITGIPGTVMDLLADREPGVFPGPSLSALWKSQNQQTNWPYPISELAQTDIIVPADRVVEGKIPIATNGWMKSLVAPRWHLITHEKFGHQLYDWTNDPKESNNLIDSPEGRATALRLASHFNPQAKIR